MIHLVGANVKQYLCICSGRKSGFPATRFNANTINQYNTNSSSSSGKMDTEWMLPRKGRHFCYLLQLMNGHGRAHQSTYIGYTVNVSRRIRQHNGEIQRGAKYTTMKLSSTAAPKAAEAATAKWWRVVMVIGGFASSRQALRFEWWWKHIRRRPRRRSTSNRRRGRHRQHAVLAKSLSTDTPATLNSTDSALVARLMASQATGDGCDGRRYHQAAHPRSIDAFLAINRPYIVNDKPPLTATTTAASPQLHVAVLDEWAAGPAYCAFFSTESHREKSSWYSVQSVSGDMLPPPPPPTSRARSGPALKK
jgi:predicted GIY-YIG superfamily endonuclease